MRESFSIDLPNRLLAWLLRVRTFLVCVPSASLLLLDPFARGEAMQLTSHLPRKRILKHKRTECLDTASFESVFFPIAVGLRCSRRRPPPPPGKKFPHPLSLFSIIPKPQKTAPRPSPSSRPARPLRAPGSRPGWRPGRRAEAGAEPRPRLRSPTGPLLLPPPTPPLLRPSPPLSMPERK